jgi:hypothetical protein
MLLAEAREKLLNLVTFTLKTEQLANGFVNEFKSLLEKHKGGVVVKVNLIDPDLRLNVSTVSTRFRISMENELIEELKRKEIEFKLN